MAFLLCSIESSLTQKLEVSNLFLFLTIKNYNTQLTLYDMNILLPLRFRGNSADYM